MNPISLLSAAEQVAGHLRDAMLSGNLSGDMPGIHQLAAELGVNHKTAAAALHQLEKEGLLLPQGTGRRRKIVKQERLAPPSLRVAILHYEPGSNRLDFNVETLHLLIEAGHAPVPATKTLTELGMNVKRIADMVKRTEADAWLVGSGSSEILRWFAEQPWPTFALFGRRHRVPLASVGPDKSTAQIKAVQRLADLGHHRIVLLTHKERRLPKPGFLEQLFLEELEAQGIHAGPYNLPNWEDNREGFHQCLNSLFRHTPPTALLIDSASLFISAQQYLARQGILAPQDVSLICTDPDPKFAWCYPSVAHINWNHFPVARRILRWANNVSHGKNDRRRTSIKAEFIEGGTMGPNPHQLPERSQLKKRSA